ncbi:MAG TPA: CBS domain-containing protein, partial [Ignavibacteriaceae bacterium]
LLINFSSLIENRIKWQGKSLSSDDLSKALELTSEKEIQSEDQRILEGIVKFGNTDVKQIMVSRIDIVSLDFNVNFKEVLKIVNSKGFSRIPVFDESFDKVSGILYIKDLLPYLNMGKDFKWNELIRKPIFVPENKKIDDLLKEFQELKIHLAIVVDEYGGTSGIITLEDILGEIVGDISEQDENDLGFQKIDDHNFLLDGKTTLLDFYKMIPVKENEFEKSKGESDTLAGFVIEIAGRIPKKMEKIKFGNVLFTVESANVKRIKEIKVTLLDD